MIRHRRTSNSVGIPPAAACEAASAVNRLCTSLFLRTTRSPPDALIRTSLGAVMAADRRPVGETEDDPTRVTRRRRRSQPTLSSGSRSPTRAPFESKFELEYRHRDETGQAVIGLFVRCSGDKAGRSGWAMGVSISRPPRCERGALPAELIAPEGLHKLAGASGSGPFGGEIGGLPPSRKSIRGVRDLHPQFRHRAGQHAHRRIGVP
jgi:hypothetical protein